MLLSEHGNDRDYGRMKIAGYASPLTLHPTPTGVGQHIQGMFAALQDRADVRFALITPRGRLLEAQKFIASHSRSRALRLPFPDRVLRLATTCVSFINLDPWLTDAEWVYAPLEQPVTTRRKLAVTIHDLYSFEASVPGIQFKKPPGLSWRRRVGRILRRADLILTVSEFTKSRILGLFEVERPERIVVVGNGGSEPFGLESGPGDEHVLHRFGLEPFRYVLFPGSLTRRKGGDLLLQVARLARTQGACLQFVVVGRRHDAALFAAFEAMKKQTPDLSVTLLGYVDTPTLAVLYRHAHATFFPSRYEGFGIPVVEALASGCPLFISSQPALVEVAAGNATVLDFDPLRILAALTTPSPRGRHVDFAHRHTWSQCAQRLVRAMA